MRRDDQITSGDGQLPSLFHLLKKFDLHPTRSLGQNFLVNEKVVTSILNILQPTEDDLIVEIGAGPGLVTYRLAEKAGRVVAIEIDRKFEALHEELFAGLARPPILIYEDARKVNYQEATQGPYSRLLVFGNLPYYLTTELILTAISRLSGMSRALFMVEDEVSLRMMAEPGNKKYGSLSMASQLFGHWKLERSVSASAFYPKPRVQSVLMTLVPSKDVEAIKTASDPSFHRFLTLLMQARRKTLANALKQAGLMEEIPDNRLSDFLSEENLSSSTRAEQLTPEQLGKLYRLIGLSGHA